MTVYHRSTTNTSEQVFFKHFFNKNTLYKNTDAQITQKSGTV